MRSLYTAVAAFIVMACLGSTSKAEEWSFRAEGSHWFSYLPDEAELARTRFEALLELTKKFGDSFSIAVSGRGFVDPSVLTSDRLPESVQSDEGRGAEFRTAYLEYRPLPWTLRLGLQEVVWGEALHFFSADILHPKDYRDLFLNSLSWSRRPQLGLSVGYENDRMSLSLVYFPISRVNRYPRFGSDFSLPEFSVETLGLPQATDEGLWKFDEPVLGGNIGVRWSELQLNFISAMIRDPQGYYEAGSIKNDRIFVGGITASYATDEWISRMEWIVNPRRRLNFVDGMTLDSSKTGELNHLSSIEYAGIENQNVSLNLHWNQRWDCRDEHLLDCRLIQAGPRWIWLNMPWDLELENSLWLEFKDKSFWWSARLRRPLSENFKAEIMIDQFVGDGSGLYSKLSRRDQVGFKIDWAF